MNEPTHGKVALASSLTLALFLLGTVVKSPAAMRQGKLPPSGSGFPGRLPPGIGIAEGIRNKAMDAQAKGHYGQAAHLFAQMLKKQPKYGLMFLPDYIRLEDRLGHFRSELGHLRQVIHPGKFFGSSEALDPVFLVRFADLAMIYGSQADAREAYAAAGRNCHAAKEFDLPNPSNLRALRARAYMVVSHSNPPNSRGYKDSHPIQLSYASLAATLSPGDPMAWITLAETQGPADSQAKWWKAEEVASATGKVAIHAYRERMGLVYGKVSHVVIPPGPGSAHDLAVKMEAENRRVSGDDGADIPPLERRIFKPVPDPISKGALPVSPWL